MRHLREPFPEHQSNSRQRRPGERIDAGDGNESDETSLTISNAAKPRRWVQTVDGKLDTTLVNPACQ
jgi:hypothetical protein